MSITEIVFPTFQPSVSNEIILGVRAAASQHLKATGLSSVRLGHILRHNGDDIQKEYRGVGALEWENSESFHAFYPASEGLAKYAAAVESFYAAAPTPQLFEPGLGSERSALSFESGATLILIGRTVERDHVSAAWDQLVAALSKEGNVNTWSGFGIEDAKGIWAGMLGWDSVEILDSVTKKGNVVQALENLKKAGEIEEYVAKFEE